MAGPGVVRLAVGLTIVALALSLVMSGCDSDTGAAPGRVSAMATSIAAKVITFAGLPGITVGASLDDLTTAGTVTTGGAGCGPAFASVADASPVFDAGQLVLIWAYPPWRTPERVGVGSSIEDVRRAYPAAVELSPPAGSQQYNGLLVTGPDDLAYLLLYDDAGVQKLIVGMRRYARTLLDTGFGSC